MDIICQITGQPFQITDWEINMLNQMGFPLPTLCINERHRKRLAWRNERSLYKRKCDLTGKSIISLYPVDSVYKVYSQEAWWGDGWDGTEYGREFDFSMPFFEQFAELMEAVPRLSLINLNAENSEFCNVTTNNKNCYLVFGGDFNQDSFYSGFNFHCKDVCDVYFVSDSEIMYESLDCEECYNVKYSQYAYQCKESAFLFDCRSLENCVGCVGLRNKKYHIFNQPYSKETYEQKVQELKLDTWSGIQKMKEQFETFRLTQPHRAAFLNQCENVTGNNLSHCKNVFNSFDLTKSQDTKDSFIGGMGAKNILSSDHFGHNIELCYEVMGAPGPYQSAFCAYPFFSQNALYCDTITHCKNVFGCTNIKRKEYCILNKQYTKGEYEDLVPKIIEHMKSSGEWGQFFPIELSPFGYNETMAQEFFPLSKEEILRKGWKWKEQSSESIRTEKIIPANQLPEGINNTPDEILDWAIECEITKKPFKIIPQELKLYRTHGIPLPHFHPEERHRQRMKLRNGYELFSRNCEKCQKILQTTYAPEREEKVYCEHCYLESIY